ncbi:MAG: hypothetical protein IPQ07_24570 [Myxococcales bacterium]|nr:hypothetical protein [Myxococcales bacterium]
MRGGGGGGGAPPPKAGPRRGGRGRGGGGGGGGRGGGGGGGGGQRAWGSNGWYQQNGLAAPVPVAEAQFGSSVAVSPNWIVVGATGEANGTGAGGGSPR